MEWSHLWNNVLNHLYIIYIYIYVCRENLIFFVCFPLSHEDSWFFISPVSLGLWDACYYGLIPLCFPSLRDIATPTGSHVTVTEQGRGGRFVSWWPTAASALLSWSPGSWKGSPSLFPASVSFLKRNMGRKSGGWFLASLYPSQHRINPKRVYFQECELRTLCPVGTAGPWLPSFIIFFCIPVCYSEL